MHESSDSLWLTGGEPVVGSAFQGGERYDVVVVGAGITGLTTALLLAERGKRVCVLEARSVAALASGNNTGKVSVLQGDRLSAIRAHHSARLTRAYLNAQRDGQRWLLDFCENHAVPVHTRTSYSYAQRQASLGALAREYAAAREAGLAVSRVTRLDVPFPLAGAIALFGQAQLDPAGVVDALARAYLDVGGVLHTGVRVIGMKASHPVRIETTMGLNYGDAVVLATGTPVLDRGLYFAKLTASRSYVVSFANAHHPEGMFLSIDSPTRSIRSVPTDGGEQLIVAGNGHPVGRIRSEAEQVRDLIDWTEKWFPGSHPTHSWAAQDYQSHNAIPFIGRMPRGRGRIYLATGFAKWGLTNGVAAAQRITAEIMGEARAPWMVTFGTRLTRPHDFMSGVVENARIASLFVTARTRVRRASPPAGRPAEGTGFVVSASGGPVGISTVNDRTIAVRAVCPHLGGILKWNDADCSWDCPLHASRFTADGCRIEGPAVSDLTQIRHHNNQA